MKQKLILNESQLHSLIKEAINMILESFEVKGSYPLQDTLPIDKMTQHASIDRADRFNQMGELGNPIYSFIVNTEHPSGDEIHTITDNAIIVVQNFNTGKIVTAFPALPGQLYRYWSQRGIDPPHNKGFAGILRKARKYKKQRENG